MPKSCVVGGCTRNSNRNPDLNFFEFPQNEQVRKQWLRFVETTRSDFKLTKWGLVCKAHFTDDCQDTQSKLKSQLGLKAYYILKKDAVPTIKAPAIPTTTNQPPKRTKRSSEVYEKREKIRVSS